jgi:hypothetical protein
MICLTPHSITAAVYDLFCGKRTLLAEGSSPFQCLTDCVSDNATSECTYFHSHEYFEWALSTCVDILLF